MMSAREVIRGVLEEAKAVDVVELDVRSLTVLADCFVIATGTSQRHLSAMAGKLRRAPLPAAPVVEGLGEEDIEWALLDFGGVIVHLMTASARAFYDLEGLWSSSWTESQSGAGD